MVALTGWSRQVMETALSHCGSRTVKREIAARMDAGASFETWMTWTLSQAFADDRNVLALPEIGYAGFLGCDGERPNGQRADLLVLHWPSQAAVLAEAAIVLPRTQSKWQRKIAADYHKLSEVPSRQGLDKLMIVYSLSLVEKVVGNPVWDDWFKAIRMGRQPLPDADFVEAFPLRRGQCAVRVWRVP